MQRHHRPAYSLVLFVGSPYVFPLCVVIHISRGCYVYYSHRIVGELSEQFTIGSRQNACEVSPHKKSLQFKMLITSVLQLPSVNSNERWHIVSCHAFRIHSTERVTHDDADWNQTPPQR